MSAGHQAGPTLTHDGPAGAPKWPLHSYAPYEQRYASPRCIAANLWGNGSRFSGQFNGIEVMGSGDRGCAGKSLRKAIGVKISSSSNSR